MKILLLLFILSISIASSQQPEWYHLDCHLLKVAWTSNTSVYAVGTNGALLRSTDKGASWRQIPTLVSDSLIGIAFSDSLHGTAVGQDGILLTSADGGISWHLQKNVTNFTLRSVTFRENIGIAVGDGGTILRSTDGGVSWVRVVNSFKQQLFVVAFAANGAALVGASGGVLLRSTDFGQTWEGATSPITGSQYSIQDISISAEGKIFAIAHGITDDSLLISSDKGKTWEKSKHIPGVSTSLSFPTASFGIIAGDTPRFQLTTDEGVSFSQQFGIDSTLYSTSILNSIAFIDKNIGIAVGDRKTMYRTTDGGEHWELLSWLPSYGTSFKAVQFITEDTGFIGSGDRGLIYHTENGGSTWLPQRNILTPGTFFGGEVWGLYFYDTKIGVAIPSSDVRALRTTDGGRIYTEQLLIVGDYPIVHFLNDDFTLILSSNIYSVPFLYQSQIHISTDKGLTWGLKKYLDSMLISYISVITKDIYYSTCLYQTNNKYALLKTQNGGETFEVLPHPSLLKTGGVYFIDENNGFLFGQDTLKRSIIFRTEDGCTTWVVVDSARFSSNTNYTRITFSDRLHGYLSCSNGYVIETHDGGKTWRTSYTPSPTNTAIEHINSFSAIGADVAYFVGGWKSGIVLKKLPKSLINSVSEPTISTGPAPSVWLYAPRPVPTSGKLQLDAIWLMNLEASTIKIKLYDMLGIELRDITDSFHSNAGTNTGIVDFDGSALATGIYYIEINGGGYRKAVPVIIAR